MKQPTVAVIDIGKTNKKIHMYTEELDLVDSRSTTLDPVERDGVPLEQTEELVEWLFDTLTWYSSRYDIRAIATTTHGACFACVKESGELSVPVVDYTHEPGESFHDEFYEIAGPRNELQRSTATLELKALVNPGKGIHFVRGRYPESFTATDRILMYDQYFPMRLSGEFTADPTYLACHTYLFDHTSKSYSAVVDRLGIRAMMPETLKDPGQILGPILPEVAARTGVSPLAKILVGIHDSNASLIPYLLKNHDEDFIVNSTGTWCVAMHPEPEVRFTEDEIGKAVFYNMSAFREPVKTTILLGGLEFEAYTDVLRERSGLAQYPAFNPDVYKDVVSRRAEFVMPAIVAGTGQYPDSHARVIEGDTVTSWESIRDGVSMPDLFQDPERAYAVVNLSLALQTVTALERIGLKNGVKVYTEGGFRNNQDYNALLAALCPAAEFYLSGMAEATSFGTALLGWAAVLDKPVKDLANRFAIQKEPVTPAEIPGLDRYAASFFSRLS